MAKILVIDDNEIMLGLAKVHLEEAGHMVIDSSESLGVTKLIREHKPDLVILDQKMPALSGHNLVKVLRKLNLRIPVYIFSNLTEEELAGLAEECGADGYILKVKGMKNMVAHVERALAAKG